MFVVHGAGRASYQCDPRLRNSMWHTLLRPRTVRHPPASDSHERVDGSPRCSPRPDAAASRARARAARAPVRACASGTARSSRATAPGGPVFTVRSPAAVAHLLRAPGQLGLGRAYAAGELEADDLDRVIGLLDTFHAPRSIVRRAARLTLAAVRACGLTRPPRDPRQRAAPARAPPQPRARRARGAPPLRRLERLLRAVPGRLDDIQLRTVLARRAARSRRRRRRSASWSARSSA